MTLLLVIQTAATLVMCGIAWFVQVVHYPLFARVGAEGYTAYQGEHLRRTTFVVFPPMIIELTCAAALIVWHPTSVPVAASWLGLALVVALWGSTGLLQVPAHRQLEQGFQVAAHRRLVSSSWLRTALWTARGVLVLWMLTA